MDRTKRAVGLGIILVSALLLQDPSSFAQRPPQIEEVAEPVAPAEVWKQGLSSLAKQLQVSEEILTTVIQSRPEIEKVLAKSEPKPGFAGVEIEYHPVAVVIYGTDTGILPSGFAGDVRIVRRAAPKSRDQLSAVQQVVSTFPGVISTTPNVPDGKIIVRTTDIDGLKEAIAARLSTKDLVLLPGEPIEPFAASGGEHVTFGAGNCSSGFRAAGGSGSNLMLTAAHCFNLSGVQDLWSGGQNSHSGAYQESCSVDAQVYTTGGTSNSVRGIPIYGSATPLNGDTVWRWGWKSGWTTGVVSAAGSTNAAFAPCSGNTFAIAFLVSGSFGVPGDSGGPVIYCSAYCNYALAKGLTSGGPAGGGTPWAMDAGAAASAIGHYIP